nr:4133_t:CDS:2 [Entrophospora candida]
MSEKWVHEYFNRRPSEWTIIGFLEECDANLFTDKIGHYLTSLMNITKNDIGNSKETAGTSIHLHHPTFKDSSLGIGMVNGGTFNTGLSPKQDQESKAEETVISFKKGQYNDDDIDDPFISDNDLAESSEFLKDNSSSSSSIKIA